MRGRLMVGVVPCMFGCLHLSQAADRKDTEHQKNRQKFQGGVVHQEMDPKDTQP